MRGRRRKIVLIDVNSVVPYFAKGRCSGVGRTTMELVKALDNYSKREELPFDIVLFSQNMRGIGGRNLNTCFKSRHLYLPNRTKWKRMLLKLHLRNITYGKYDIVHIPHNFDFVGNPQKTLITLHDAMFFACPEDNKCYADARVEYKGLAERCKSIITCSESSKRDIVSYLGVPATKVDVAYWGYNENLMHKYPGNKENLFVSVSCDLGRKNTISVIRAFKIFQQRNKNANYMLKLVCSTIHEELLNECRSEVENGTIQFLSNIGDEELAELYSRAKLSFFPSKYEGFGLPILESMACGTPVVTCRNSSLEEVGGDAAIYVEPEDVEAMSDWMMSFAEGKADMDMLEKKMTRQVSKFSWEKCAEEVIGVYKKCLDI